ncbi:MAG TPA: hypothetical protein PKA00_18020 [Saprospiraceae bacterium]|nr:hypothetical protein [Saprospiraceae bacterium]HMQ84815.1 hypothetical protein [Saprospiraceae bacterium]
MNSKEGTYHMANQIKQLIDRIAPLEYAMPLEVFNGSSLGQHFRHILEFYICLMDGIETGVVDYASRKRNLAFETNPEEACRVFMEVASQVGLIDEFQTVQVRADFSDQPEVIRPVLQSTVGRELMFAYDHAIHHLAMVKIGLAALNPAALTDQNLGVAPSTLKYRQIETAVEKQ